MKRDLKSIFKLSAFSSLFLIAIGCGGDEGETTKFTLVVNDGTGSGQYASSMLVKITANTPPTGKEFEAWTGDISQLDSVTNPAGKITMPANNIEVNATYRAIDLGSPVNISIDKSTSYQTVDGFGFFGAYDVWWSGGSLWNDAWGEKMIGDLGITIWRNEYFPPSTPDNRQTEWTTQKPVVEGLKAKADKYNVDLKFIFTVWSPPSDLKWQSNFTWPGDVNATRNAGTVSTKNGGTLNPNKYTEYADWLKAGIQLYEDAGVDLYALSLQNELMFVEPYNSCTYTFSWYNDLLNNVVPKIKTTYPAIKLFGAENMLDLEGADENWPYFYHSNIKANPTATANIDILAVHGYTDGVAPSSGSGLVKRWTNHLEQFSKPMNKPTWMTETSGYNDTWESSGGKPGAINLAQDIHAGLYYGNMSAWVWWQGSGGEGSRDEIDEFALMRGLNAGKKYFTSKHFYRYIRPGAVRVKSISDDADVFVTAFQHSENGTHTIVMINSGIKDKLISLSGVDLPASFAMYRTNASTENCVFIDNINSGTTSSFILPAKTIVTLQAGGDPL
ncbi:MAG: glycoside hydrolase family 30 beta sandwich domain-containing protein [Chryseolinea sp.]